MSFWNPQFLLSAFLLKESLKEWLKVGMPLTQRGSEVKVANLICMQYIEIFFFADFFLSVFIFSRVKHSTLINARRHYMAIMSVLF